MKHNNLLITLYNIYIAKARMLALADQTAGTN